MPRRGDYAKRRYSEDDKAAALAVLAANGGNLKRTAGETGVPLSTLLRWRDAGDPAVAQKCDVKKAALGDLFEEVARLYVGRAMEKGVVRATRGKDAVVAAAAATDKSLLLRKGQPPPAADDAADLDLSRLTPKELADFEYLLARAAGKTPGAARAG